MTVQDVLNVTTENVRIEKWDEKGRMVDFDIKNATQMEVKKISTWSDGGSKWLRLVV